ncbi:MAG: diadenylate cyclase CdaA [Bacillota bacterium]
MEDILLQIQNSITQFTFKDIIDILIVAYLLYRLLLLVNNTRAMQGLKGLGILLIASRVCDMLKLTTVSWLLANIISAGALVLIILFQPELRRALEQIGRKTVFDSNTLSDTEASAVSTEIHRALLSMSKQRIGALIVIEQTTQLGELIDTGTRMDGRVTASLIETVFYPGTMLHDGAMIIRGLNAVAAGCFLPLSNSDTISKALGTRHRAALGVSEQSDSVTFIVSEETGNISVARDGKLRIHLDAIAIRLILEEIFMKEDGASKPWSKILRRQKSSKETEGFLKRIFHTRKGGEG